MCIRALFCVLFSALIIFCASHTAMAANDLYAEVSTDSRIINTLNVMKKHNAESQKTLKVILSDNLANKPMKIMFYDLSAMGGEFQNMDAVACKKKNDDRIYILINKIHQNAPAEALASLLAHEIIHQDDVSSIEEEITGWTNEAKAWISYKAANPDLKNVDSDCLLVKRLNTIEKMYTAAGYTTTKIASEIVSINGYAVLPKHSPGYGI